MKSAEEIILPNRNLPLDVLTALLGHTQSRERSPYPDTGESGETYDVECRTPELPLEAG